MTITAKYASLCPCCNQPITPGTKVEWSKGSKARHVACASSDAAPAVTYAGRGNVADMPRRSSRGGSRWTGCSCGSRELSCGTTVPGRSGRMCA